jgi:YbgC/YbaW family acyl-CoA thioester hydrolase
VGLMATFKTTYRVTRVDRDASGAVHFHNYFCFFQRAEEDFYRNISCNLQEIMDKYDVWIRKVEAFCQLKKPSQSNDLLEIEVAVKEIEEKAVRYAFTMREKETGVTVAEGHVIEVAEDKCSSKVVSIPSELAEKLKAFAKSTLKKEQKIFETPR